jgi:hypothetical protein
LAARGALASPSNSSHHAGPGVVDENHRSIHRPSAQAEQSGLQVNLYTVIIGLPILLVAIVFKESLPGLGSTGFVLSLVLVGLAIWTLAAFYRLCRSVTSWYVLWFALFFVPVLGLVVLVGVIYLGFRQIYRMRAHQVV